MSPLACVSSGGVEFPGLFSVIVSFSMVELLVEDNLPVPFAPARGTNSLSKLCRDQHMRETPYFPQRNP